jgi:hypothetical protein
MMHAWGEEKIKPYGVLVETLKRRGHVDDQA